MVGTVAIGQAKCKKLPYHPVLGGHLTRRNCPDQFWLLRRACTGRLRGMPEPRRLYEQIAQQLAKSIADGKHEVGQRLPSERELAQTFGVSRPTVREAIIALELDGLVDVRLGSGVYVKNRRPPGGTESAKDIGPFELLEARRIIEGEACALAALRIGE